MDYEIAKRTAFEILEEDGFLCASIYLKDLARSGGITWEESTNIGRELIASGFDCSLATF